MCNFSVGKERKKRREPIYQLIPKLPRKKEEKREETKSE